MNDHELLREFVRNRSQDAFRQLVERHVAMVYSAASRLVRDEQLAQDVVQNVFSLFAQKAGTLTPPLVIGGWLYNTTRNQALHAIRTEVRRREREQTAVAMQTLEADSNPSRIAEQLEPVMAELDADERDALVLRYLENRSLREVGTELGISEDAARMRVNRALDRMRTVLAGRGVGITSAVLATALGASTVSAVPAGLAATVTATALAGVATTTATATTAAVTTLHWINAKAVAAIAAAAVISGAGTYVAQQRQIDRLQANNQILAAQQAKLATDNEAAQTAVRAQQDELARLQKNTSELLRLRNEVSQMRRQREDEQKAALAMKNRAQISDVVTAPGGATPILNPAALTGLVFDSELAVYTAKLGETNGTFSFHFRNVSDVPVHIAGVNVSCGCTTVELPALPWVIQPGANEVLKATMNFAGKPPGDLVKTLTVVATNGSKTLLVRAIIPNLVGQPGPARPYISKSELANVGYATPEAALQTITWAMMTGDYDQARAALAPELAKNDPDTAESRAQFESGRSKMAPLFKGMQVVALKTLSDVKVELKVRQEYDPAIIQTTKRTMPDYMVQPMVKVGSDWKLGGSTHEYNARWDDSGQIESFVQ